jgi:hypothetical protein
MYDRQPISQSDPKSANRTLGHLQCGPGLIRFEKGTVKLGNTPAKTVHDTQFYAEKTIMTGE